MPKELARIILSKKPRETQNHRMYREHLTHMHSRYELIPVLYMSEVYINK